jgi:hypothetical protein
VDACRTSGTPSSWKSITAAFRTIWKQKRLDDTLNQLKNIRDELSFRVLISIKAGLDLRAIQDDSRIQKYDDATKTIVQAITRNETILKSELQVQCQDLQMQLQTRLRLAFDDIDLRADQRHEALIIALKSLPTDISRERTQEADAGRVWERTQEIVSRLYYNQIDDRFEDIAPAHKKTFEWLFTESSRCNFSTWLRDGHGIYWVCGKAGSGKSTLMKLIKCHLRFETAVNTWAAETPLLVLSFFFWRSGTDVQRSYRGLLRSLLYQALKAFPNLTEVVFPGLFDHRLDEDIDITDFLTYRQLKSAFMALIKQGHVPLKIVLLIDGLDEYESQDMGIDELVEVLQTAAESPRLKIILSSRPILILERAFAEHDLLRLEDLTEPDILAYTNDKLRTNADLATVAKKHMGLANELVHEIVHYASGVFLWVKLVTQSLIEGFQNRDSIALLQERLRELPRDLEKLFLHMLNKVEPRYQIQSSKTLQLLQCIRHSREFLNNRNYRLTAIGLSFALQPSGNISHILGNPLDEEELEERLQETKVHLKVHCAGLVELGQDVAFKDLHNTTTDGGSIGQGNQSLERVATSPEIRYLHRSVADFLDKKEIWDKVVESSRHSDFDVFQSLLHSTALQLTRIQLQGADPRNAIKFGSFLYSFIRFARLAEYTTQQNSRKLLRNLDRIMSKTLKPWTGDSHWSGIVAEGYPRPLPWHDSFLSFTVRSGLNLFVREQFEQYGSSILEKKGRPLLDYACRPEPNYSVYVDAINPDLVETLLQYGANPNQMFNTWTPWQNALYSFYQGSLCSFNGLAVLKWLIIYGADINGYAEHRWSGGYKVMSALHILEEKLKHSYLTYEEDEDQLERYREMKRHVCDMLRKRGARKWQHMFIHRMPESGSERRLQRRTSFDMELLETAQ